MKNNIVFLCLVLSVCLFSQNAIAQKDLQRLDTPSISFRWGKWPGHAKPSSLNAVEAPKKNPVPGVAKPRLRVKQTSSHPKGMPNAVYIGIGAAFATISLVPLIGNVYALSSGNHRGAWGGVGLAIVGFLGCMMGYTATAHGNFVGDRKFVYAQIPTWSLWAITIGLCVANLLLNRQAQNTGQKKSLILPRTTLRSLGLRERQETVLLQLR